MTTSVRFPNPLPRRGGRPASTGFTLVELLAVIAIISILMTLGLVGVKNLVNGKGTMAAVASAEALFEEARLIAASKSTTARVLVSVDNEAHGAEALRRMLVAFHPLDSATGLPDNTRWELSSRGYLMPEGVYFSNKFSSNNHALGEGSVKTDTFTFAQTNLSGKYAYYEFNSQGLCTSPGASFIVGSGARPKNSDPRVSGSSKRDFSGFVIWRNGRTSVFRHPDQIGIDSSVTTF